MHDATVLSAGEAALLLTEVTGSPYELVGRLSGGETGAHEFLAPDGRSVVVKWDADPTSRRHRAEAVRLSERLRIEAGWPVPAQSMLDVDEVCFVIQEFMPGSPVERLDHRVVDQLLELHDRRLGLARPDDPVHWPGELIDTLTIGGQGYCVHASLYEFDQRTRSLIERIEAFGHSVDPTELTTSAGDIIHWDFHTGNLLVQEGLLAAVVDTDFAIVGDARFDLVTLAISSMAVPCERGVGARLTSWITDELADLRTQAYLAHLLLRVIDWPIRRGRPHEVELWLQKAQELLLI